MNLEVWPNKVVICYHFFWSYFSDDRSRSFMGSFLKKGVVYEGKDQIVHPPFGGLNSNMGVVLPQHFVLRDWGTGPLSNVSGPS